MPEGVGSGGVTQTAKARAAGDSLRFREGGSSTMDTDRSRVHTGGILTRFQRDRGTRATLTVAGVCGLDTGTSSASQSQVCWPFSGSGPHMPPLQPQEQ